MRAEKKLSEEEVQAAVTRARAALTDKLREAPTLLNPGESQHQAALAKEKHMIKLREALKISDGHEFGAAFDLEAQEQKRLAKLADKEQ